MTHPRTDDTHSSLPTPSSEPPASQVAELHPQIFVSEAPKYWAAQLPAIPLRTRDKPPAIKRWNEFARRMPSLEEQQAYLAQHPAGNIGLALGPQSGLIAVDIDSDSPEVIANIVEALPRSPWHRIGAKGKVLIYRANGMPTVRIRAKDATKPICEILSEGAQIVLPPSIHPTTQKPYTANAELLDVLDDIQVLPTDAERLIRQALERAGVELSKSAPSTSEKSTPTLRVEDLTASSGPTKQPLLETIIDACNFMRNARDNAATLGEWPWYQSLTIAARCKDGRRLAHELSQTYPGYSEAETDKKIEHALKDTGPARCDRIKSDGFPGCATCPFSGTLTSPIQIGYENPKLAKLQVRHVLSAQTRQLYDIKTGDCITHEHFNTAYGHLLRKPLPFTAFRASSCSPKVHRFDYVPGTGELIIHEANGKKICNIWRDDGITPVDGKCDKILAHLEYLIPNADELNHLLNVLAALVQHHSKIGHMIIIVGVQGTGKSWIRLLLAKMLGQSNVDHLDGEHLHSKFRAQFTNKEVLFVEELMHAGRLELYNSLKCWVVDDLVKVEEKNIPLFTARTPRLIIASSNHEVPIYLEEGDRRAFLVHSPAKPKDKEYYQNMFNVVMPSEAAAFKHWLGQRDITHFEPMARPPMTEAKALVIRESRPPLARELAEKIAEGTGWFEKDIVTCAQTQLGLKGGAFFAKDLPTSEVTKALRQVGAIHWPDQVKDTNNRPVRLWIIRNHEVWGAATNAAIGAYYRAPVTR